MSVFLRRFIDNKKYIVIAMVSVFVCGLLFGFYQYSSSIQGVKVFFSKFILS